MGVGIAQGYATIGAIGFEGRWDYGAIGTVTNLAARLCGEAKGGQVLVTSRVATALEDLLECEEVGALSLKGLLKPVPTYSVIGLRPHAA
jgi:class 3 adenylate cyclase